MMHALNRDGQPRPADTATGTGANDMALAIAAYGRMTQPIRRSRRQHTKGERCCTR